MLFIHYVNWNQLGNGLVSLSAKLPLKLITRFCLKMSKKGKVCLVKQIFDLQG